MPPAIRSSFRRVGDLRLLVLVVAVYAFRGPILEQWYVWELKTATEEERWTIAEKLEGLGSEAAEDWYIGRLDSKSFETRKRAAVKLANLRSQKAIPQFLSLLKQDKEFLLWVTRSLRPTDDARGLVF